jgi:hypothetical protein
MEYSCCCMPTSLESNFKVHVHITCENPIYH